MIGHEGCLQAVSNSQKHNYPKGGVHLQKVVRYLKGFDTLFKSLSASWLEIGSSCVLDLPHAYELSAIPL